jgi:phenylpyruvate tautomerase PptA (4-oxalocrotonate tautomerase family)
MPHLRIRALKESAVQELSVSLPQELSKILNTAEDNFTIERIGTTFYRNGTVVAENEADPMLEFLWFDRGAEVRKLAAQKVTELIRPHTKSEYISVVFIDIPKENYFENGVSF